MKKRKPLKTVKDKQRGDIALPKVKYLLIRLRLRTVIRLKLKLTIRKYVKKKRRK